MQTIKADKNLELIVIDYLQLMQSSGRTESRQNEIAEISRSLKILAKELNIPVIALSQLSRAAESEAISVPCFRTCVNRVLSSRTPIWLCFVS